MKVGLSFGSKTGNPIISPAKEKPDAANDSRDETFFDSRAYLDSDCDDDFFSVNGDFTPSRGNTPVHHNSFSAGAPRIYKVADEGSPGSASETSPGKKKKLVELFRDNIKEDQDVNELNTSINRTLPMESSKSNQQSKTYYLQNLPMALLVSLELTPGAVVKGQ